MLPSMTDGAHCCQNAVAERVNGILKDEFNLDASFPSMADARTAVAHAVLIYTRSGPAGVSRCKPRTLYSTRRRSPHSVPLCKH